MHGYIAYGLRIRAAVDLPQLVSAETPTAEVVIRVENLGRYRPARGDREECLRTIADGIYVLWKDIGSFLVRDGAEVLVDPTPGVPGQILALAIGGPILALVLHQRGFLVLHSSVVCINGGAAAFLGGQGCGKSTLAATLYDRGHIVVSDDVSAVRFDDGHASVLPSYPQLKVWPDTISFLQVVPESLPRLYPQFDKRAYSAARGFSEAAVPLKRVYVLSVRDTYGGIEGLKPQDAFKELVRHTYGAQLATLDSAVAASDHVQQCARLVSSVPVCKLARDRSLASLPDLARLVEEDMIAR